MIGAENIMRKEVLEKRIELGKVNFTKENLIKYITKKIKSQKTISPSKETLLSLYYYCKKFVEKNGK